MKRIVIAVLGVELALAGVALASFGAKAPRAVVADADVGAADVTAAERLERSTTPIHTALATALAAGAMGSTPWVHAGWHRAIHRGHVTDENITPAADTKFDF